MPEPAIIALVASSAPFATKLAHALSGTFHMRGREFTKTADHCRALFQAGIPIIFLGASGIIIRALAPLLGNKWNEPPVLCVADHGRVIVPLLGGHRGANVLAKEISAAFGTKPSITTAGDIELGIALDAPPAGWRLENADDAGQAVAALLEGKAATLSGKAEWLAPLSERVTKCDTSPEAPVVLRVTGAEPLIYRRQNLTLGVGCARGCPPDELIALVGKTMAEAGYSTHEISAVHSLDLKTDEAAIHALAAHLDIPARFHTKEALNRVKDHLKTPSDVVFAETGCYGVAEAAALVGGGEKAILKIAKTKSANATCALALGASGAAGKPRGQLAVIGIGPGSDEWRTPEATRYILEADELVGYGLYLDLLGALIAEKPQKRFDLGQEEARCRYALEAAGSGKKIALICSGDGGIYAMGALVMELLARSPEAGGVTKPARQSKIIHVPGISALQAASARTGAILGHDFCAISLSDLLTPRDVIIERLKAAAQSDFVIAFYNPVSAKRRTLLSEARRILLNHRPKTTPVLLATHLGRRAERLRPRTLETLQVDEVDMMTVVIVGASTTKFFPSGDIMAGADGGWFFTPRGYARKIDGDLT